MILSLVASLICAAQPLPPMTTSAPAQPANQHPPVVPDETTPVVSLGTAFGGVNGNQGQPEVQRLLKRIAATLSALQPDDKQVRLQLLLASANLRLSRSAEPAASRYLLGLQSAEDLRRWNDTATSALEDLELARETSRQLPDPATEQEEADYDRHDENLELMAAFARMFLALAQSDAGDTAALAQALGDLSGYLELEDERLARAATLWQAVALHRLGRPDRAVDLLSLPLSKPGPAPVELFIRLERLACLADRDDLEAAMVLALRMEEACLRWYQDQHKQAEARHALLWLRLRFFDRYLQRAQDRPGTDQLDAWRRLTDQIRQTLLEDGRPATLARLGRTIPVLVDPAEALQAAERLRAEPLAPPPREPPPAEQPAVESAPAEEPPPAAPPVAETAPAQETAPAEQPTPLE